MLYKYMTGKQKSANRFLKQKSTISFESISLIHTQSSKEKIKEKR